MALSTDSQCENHVRGPFRALHRLAPSQEPGRDVGERQGQLTLKQDGHTWGEARSRRSKSTSFSMVLLASPAPKAAPASSQGRHTLTNHADSSDPEAACTQRTSSVCTRELRHPERKDCFQNYCRGRGTQSWVGCALSLVLEFLSPEQPDRSGVGV